VCCWAVIAKFTEFDVPPPGVGLKTVTDAVPALAMSAAVMDAVSWVDETNVVVRLAPFHLTTEPETKLLPLIVSVNAGYPTVREEGFRLVTVGTGLLAPLMVKVRAPEVPPPGVGLKTVTDAVPALAMSAAVMDAVSWVDETNVVVRLAPFQRTMEPVTKLVPVTVRVKAAPPAVAEEGLRAVSVGTGLLTVKLTELDVLPPGLATETGTVPAVARSDAGMAAVS